jgi:hypothetical protein
VLHGGRLRNLRFSYIFSPPFILGRPWLVQHASCPSRRLSYSLSLAAAKIALNFGVPSSEKILLSSTEFLILSKYKKMTTPSLADRRRGRQSRSIISNQLVSTTIEADFLF